MINHGDVSFVLLSAALVFVMTPGLAFFYGGMVRKTSVLTIVLQSFASMGIVTTIWFLFGFSLAFGTDVHGIIGGFNYLFLENVILAGPNPHYGGTIPLYAYFAFQEMFAIITPALITGAFAGRMRFRAYLIFLTLWSIIVYIPVAHWVWGGGFLQQMGFADFAGGAVVHASAGLAALASVFVLGSRTFKKDEPHNITYVALGTGLLWFGWFGFNAGSALHADSLAANAFVNTDIAASVALITWLIFSWIIRRRPSLMGALTGSVAGLAAVTPASGYIHPWAAAVIGVAASLACYGAIEFRKKVKWDDALDVWGVHGVGGILGIILTGVFALRSINGVSGLIEGNVHQFLVELLGVAIVAGYSFVLTYLMLKLISVFMPIRVSEEEEGEGLDVELGEAAYQL
ncbi:MAG TPA: ammonium transporter [Candidatus Fraserbacteria bacterium]|nr:ammonium transporter [Candidatus Fraserbacteria bacterium]